MEHDASIFRIEVRGSPTDQPEKLKPFLLTSHLAGMCKWCFNKL